MNVLMNEPDSCDRPGEWLDEVNLAAVSEAALKYARIYLRRGNAHLSRNDYDQALRAFETSLQLQTNYPLLNQRYLAESYERLGRVLIISRQGVAKGMEYVRKSLEICPYQSLEYAPDTLALGYLAHERYAEAVAWLEEQL